MKALRRLLWRIRHRLAHAAGWNLGKPDTWWEGEILMVGFRCDGCGKLQDCGPVDRAATPEGAGR